ncbi:type I-E CRISPR-associated protein Cas7/Cse4/CasC [Geobacter sulfurreducens]|uniref:CRISPR processing complex protein CasC n=1 Tax=Geobacter sulfurreducens (strain ATCC 51573 / DSM 12127 / PCA) TaxID=243231 RepID=Q74DC9_GEOSL|nr:type I-E CRISPR-associated protein Cas7/Cse4/CasC [Geobacter sulfurreducens]AAR34763.1 CRISPR processing complex protein CasC [Geobacter sulfurreducens PCA]ADI84214.1 CRISPR processing complex protein CasC [Geobacter sulfurreducens KN400]UAC05407.1 type I-E CRISPR-associated protein Cas7/Cse4/CasC [Geobacter sulfurreducens]HBB68534.1 type I-E CRISPR-associated protein Cas7/Cse4/CasC [Geobacter sulfurreducens]HCD95558.1 type I-E CRISPR-associated protein Cas7/Cse4/CasC [Geobacter sulfurreduc
MKNFINFHILISHSPSCLNRDDMNMQKSAVFGGERRVRVSSQSLKRAIRKSDYYRQHLGEASVRTKKLDELIAIINDRLAGRYDTDLLKKTVGLLAGKELSVEVATEGDAVAPWAIEEVAWFCEQVKRMVAQGQDEKALGKLLKNETAAMRQALASGVDIALSGRMATSGLMSELGKVDGALAVAHVLTTHSVDADIDWFTAVDDLQELGSGHLDTQEFSSGVFYRYASLNVKQLQENLGNAPREKALEIGAHLLHMLATIVPSAKQQSFAAHNLADLALVSFSDIPVSLANAFEKPVRSVNGSGFKEPSIAELHNYWQQIHTGYGLSERCGEFILGQSSVPEGITRKSTIEELKTWVMNNGEG